MNLQEAKDQLIEICKSPETITEEKAFIQEELCKYIYEQSKDSQYLVIIASNIEDKNPELVEKIYKQAIADGDEHSCFYLANLYYSGKLGRPDYEKAFTYYSRAALTKQKGNGSFEDPVTSVHNEAKLKLAMMYRNGIFVVKDFDRYEQIVNEVYEEVKDKEWHEERYFGLIAKAKLEIEKGNFEEGINLLFDARIDIASCFDAAQMKDALEDLKEVNDLIYAFIELDLTEIDALDITELLKYPLDLSFTYQNEQYGLKTIEENGGIIIEFEGRYYKDVIEFIMNAKIGDEFFRAALFKTDNWEVIR